VIQLGIVGAGLEQLRQGRDCGRELAKPLLTADLLQPSLRIGPAGQDGHGDAQGEPPPGESLSEKSPSQRSSKK
jgi:hypothetical protein